MDPFIYEFAIDYNLLVEVLVTIVIFSFFIERALSVLFESALFIRWYEPGADPPENPPSDGDPPPKKKKKGIKELISSAVSIAAVSFWNFDAVTILMKSHDEPQNFGFVLTGLIVAGGSKASIKLFRDSLGFMSSAEQRRQEAKRPTAAT